MQLGDGELPGVGAVAVVVQRQVGLVLRAPGFAPEHDRFVLVGQVAVDDVEHPPRGLAQSFGVHRAPRPGADAGGLVDQDLLGGGELLDRGVEGCLFGGADDDADLVGAQLPGGVGLTGVVVLRLEELGEVQTAGVDLAGGAGQRGGPGVGAGGGLVGGDLAAFGLGEDLQAQRLGLGLQGRQRGQQLAELVAVHPLERDLVGPGQVGARLAHRGGRGGGRERLDRHASILSR